MSYTCPSVCKLLAEHPQLQAMRGLLAGHAAPLAPAGLGLTMPEGRTGGVAEHLYVKKLEVCWTMQSRARGL